MKSALTTAGSLGPAQCCAGGRGRSAMTFHQCRQVGRAAMVQVRGELDPSTAPRLSEELMSLCDEGALDVTVALAELDFIDSSGLQALVAGLKRLRAQGGNLELRAPKPSSLKVFEITGLTSASRLEATEGAGSVCTSVWDAHSVAREMAGELSSGAVD